MSFRERTDRKELLDEEDIPETDLRRNLTELEFINRYLGGHRITLRAFRQLAATPAARSILRHRSLHICEIGCGGGDNLQVIDRWAHQQGMSLTITGVDMKETCTHLAAEKSWHSPSSWITRDYREADVDQPDIVFSSLFCHHFPDSAMPGMLSWMKEKSTCGFFINDLHRHPMAYHSIKWLTRAFSRSYLVRNDAPLSVRRAFVRRDWEAFLSRADIRGARIHWQWAFRWLVLAPRQT
jgi:2-polyprenyl-3-methyl-5-hydroxy-6-metoxy-1,4-benzoquinol methylase